MFIGHYALAPIAAATGKVNLWQAFVAVQFVDFLWAGFILTNIEKMRIMPGFTAANAFDLYHMPYTHSLVASVGWALLGGGAFKWLTRAKTWTGAVLVAALVFSHWLGDLLVHIPDLQLIPSSSPDAAKFGFGLWKNIWISFPLELGLTLAAFAYYIGRTTSRNTNSTKWTAAFMGLLIALQSIGNFGPPPETAQEAAVTALIAFSLLAFLASRYERTRDIKTAG